MESRRVTLTLEVDTAAPLDALQRAASYNVEVLSKGESYECDVVQAAGNVIQQAPKKKAAPKPKAPRKK